MLSTPTFFSRKKAKSKNAHRNSWSVSPSSQDWLPWQSPGQHRALYSRPSPEHTNLYSCLKLATCHQFSPSPRPTPPSGFLPIPARYLCPCGATFGEGGDPNIVFSHLGNTFEEYLNNTFEKNLGNTFEENLNNTFHENLDNTFEDTHSSQRRIMNYCTSTSLTAFSIFVKHLGITYFGGNKQKER